ncbi:hypothetical protein GCM10011391_10180 [Pullulanibacillus camelliae]|uniref:Damage-inducible protein DinB n=1 Tax=Pullulanibacillus camelliae TaxID=1707096 RepID=A0A8J2VP26_9BACL|nr:DinB family protein [Pullulanibacillus camelliae]GGE33477.1 hypothetical protein GCM10011391_10180 [Pullulanibacillus camelliae]
MKEQTLSLYNYHKWANQRLFDHLHKCPEELYTQEIKSVFSSIAEVIEHVYLVDQIWFSVIKQLPYEETMKCVVRVQEAVKGKSLVDLDTMYRSLSEEFYAYLADQEDLDTIIVCEHPSYGRLDTPLSQLVQHVVNHGTYHRGNITAMLRQMGHKGVPTDYIFYLYEMNED